MASSSSPVNQKPVIIEQQDLGLVPPSKLDLDPANNAFLNLPHEVALDIFSKLDKVSLNKVRLTCTTFRNHTDHSYFWESYLRTLNQGEFSKALFKSTDTGFFPLLEAAMKDPRFYKNIRAEGDNGFRPFGYSGVHYSVEAINLFMESIRYKAMAKFLEIVVDKFKEKEKSL